MYFCCHHVSDQFETVDALHFASEKLQSMSLVIKASAIEMLAFPSMRSEVMKLHHKSQSTFIKLSCCEHEPTSAVYLPTLYIE